MLRHFITLITISTLFIRPLIAQEVQVSNRSEFDAALKSLSAGGTIVLSNGNWKDVELNAYGKGSKEDPVIIKAETAGEVILSGDSSLNIYGTYVIVSGLWFKDGHTTQKSVVQFRKDSKEFGTNCRFTNSTISYYGTKDANNKNHWVDIWGNHNRVDHNNFTGKLSEGTTVVVWLKESENIENHHQIDHNFFGPRPDLVKNGGESIRIGTSTNSKKSSKTLVDYNTFKNCDGEIEIISNKSGDNIFRGNLFIESKGTLTLRHGDNALVENNVFLGNNVPNTGGIRVINSGHIVRNNLMIGLTGEGYRGPISIMNGVPNSPLNRYEQVKDVDIENNTIINCGPMTFGAGKDDEKSLPPVNSVFANNLITNTNSGKIYDAEDSMDGINFQGNIVDSDAAIDVRYFTKASIDWAMLKNIPMPTDANEILKSVKKMPKSPDMDITGAQRDVYVAGAFNLNNSSFPKALLTKIGPGWTPHIVTPKVLTLPTELEVEPGVGTLRKAIDKAPNGAIIKLKAGNYFLDKSIRVDKHLSIKGATDGETIIVANETLEKALTYIFRAEEGARLHLEHLVMDGSSSEPIKYAIVSPDKDEAKTYSIFADYCTFKNFTNTNGGSIYKAYNGTKADTLSFTNSTFKDSYRGLNLSYDKDNFGQYNAEVILLKNSSFTNLKEFALNYVRSISDPNMEGGTLLVDHCVFSDVNNEADGRILRTNGIHNVIISNSAFVNSYRIKNPISLAGFSNSINNCLFDDSGFLKTTKGASEENIIYKNPKWDDRDLFIPSKNSPLLKANNGIETIGLLQN